MQIDIGLLEVLVVVSQDVSLWPGMKKPAKTAP